MRNERCSCTKACEALDKHDATCGFFPKNSSELIHAPASIALSLSPLDGLKEIRKISQRKAVAWKIQNVRYELSDQMLAAN